VVIFIDTCVLVCVWASALCGVLPCAVGVCWRHILVWHCLVDRVMGLRGHSSLFCVKLSQRCSGEGVSSGLTDVVAVQLR
jgi:hypothetical protein